MSNNYLDEEAGNAAVAKKTDIKKSWADLFSSNRLYTKDMMLQYIQPLEGRMILNFADANLVEQAIDHCLVG